MARCSLLLWHKELCALAWLAYKWPYVAEMAFSHSGDEKACVVPFACC
jgi:hypothetical protein